MQPKTFGCALEVTLALAFNKFNLAYMFRAAKDLIYETNLNNTPLAEKFNECGTSACVLGHAQLLRNDLNYSLSNLCYDLCISDGNILDRLGILLGFFYSDDTRKLFQSFWGTAEVRKVTNLQAADLIRFIRLHKTLPADITCAKYYTDFNIHSPDKGILYYCGNDYNRIKGAGTTAEQAILDWVEQLTKAAILQDNLP